jgi:hypothetical protein
MKFLAQIYLILAKFCYFKSIFTFSTLKTTITVHGYKETPKKGTLMPLSKT